MDVLPPDRVVSAAAPAACAAWFGPCAMEVGPAAGAGFSGVPLVRVRPKGGTEWFMLKAFPAGTAWERAAWVHLLVRHLAAAGVSEVPRPCATPTGSTVVTDSRGTHWELVPFVAGEPTDAPSDAQAAAALEALARVHVAAATLPGATPRPGPSAGVLRRIAQARALAGRPWRVRRAEAPADDDPLSAAVAGRRDRAIALLDTPRGARAVAAIADARTGPVPLQAVLRDVWSAHVLFAPACGGRVAGIVDVHAASIDTPAADLGRLLGSWRRGGRAAEACPATAWADALAAYAAVRPLAPAELRVVSFTHAAGIVCGLDNWFRWTLEDRRRFPAPGAVVARIDWLLDALPAAIEWLAAGVPPRV